MIATTAVIATSAIVDFMTMFIMAMVASTRLRRQVVDEGGAAYLENRRPR
jgi:hypothetical protein